MHFEQLTSADSLNLNETGLCKQKLKVWFCLPVIKKGYTYSNFDWIFFRIKVALRKKWEETGSGFSGSQQLIEAAFRAQHRQEERSNVENNSTQSPFSSETFPALSSSSTSTSASTSGLAASSSSKLSSPNDEKKSKLESDVVSDDVKVASAETNANASPSSSSKASG